MMPSPHPLTGIFPKGMATVDVFQTLPILAHYLSTLNTSIASEPQPVTQLQPNNSSKEDCVQLCPATVSSTAAVSLGSKVYS